MYFMSDPQTLHVTRNVIPGKLGVDLHLHRVHIPLVFSSFHPCNTRSLRVLGKSCEMDESVTLTHWPIVFGLLAFAGVWLRAKELESSTNYGPLLLDRVYLIYLVCMQLICFWFRL